MDVNEILIRMAAENGLSVSEVRRDIQSVLDDGWNSPDQNVREYWHRIHCSGEKPTIEEVIVFMDKEVERKLL